MERYSQISQVTEYKLRKKTENLKSKKKKKITAGIFTELCKSIHKENTKNSCLTFFFFKLTRQNSVLKLKKKITND